MKSYRLILTNWYSNGFGRMKCFEFNWSNKLENSVLLRLSRGKTISISICFHACFYTSFNTSNNNYGKEYVICTSHSARNVLHHMLIIIIDSIVISNFTQICVRAFFRAEILLVGFVANMKLAAIEFFCYSTSSSASHVIMLLVCVICIDFTATRLQLFSST